MNRLRLASFVRRSALVTGLALGFVGTGCGSGGQTGGELPAAESCGVRYETLGLDSPTPLGATPESLLGTVLGTHASPLLWSSNTDRVSIGPEQGLSQLELTASYEGGRIAWARFAPDMASATPEAPALLVGCAADRLEVELDVWLRTSGGALDEHFVATLHAASADIAELTARRTLDAFEGSFFVTAPAGVKAPAVQITAVWDRSGFHGSLIGEVESTYRAPNAGSNAAGSVGFSFVPFAAWPPPASSAP